MALRYWVGNGSSSNWNATAPTNWSATSGGANDASVPTSVDDVIFDGAGATGNTNSTISATITILSLNITTGYTATMTHNANLTLAGGVGSVWTYHGGYTISGTSNIIINGSLTLTSNGTTWINSVSLATGTITLVGDFTVNGSTTVTNSCTINRTTTEVYRTNGISHSSQSVSGTATIILTGGTWNSGVFGASLNNNLEFAGNVTIASIVNKAAGILKYTSGTITTTGSTFYIFGSCTLDTNGITWNNITYSNTTTTTLTSNLSIGGLLTISGTTTINRSTAETVTCAGGMTINAALSGTANINWTGGTWTQGAPSTYAINNNLTISGNVTFNGANPTYGTGTFTYSSGSVTTTGSTFNISSTCTINSNGITWNNFSSVNNIKTITLTSNITINGLLTITPQTTINKNTSETITCAGGMTINAGLSGTAEISWTGGTWSQGATTYGIANNTTIAGNVTFSGANTNIAGGTWTYSSGTVTTTSNTLTIRGNCTLNLNGTSLNDMIVNTGITITLTSNLLLNGILTPINTSTINRTTTETLTCNGMNFNAANRVLVGTAKIILIGGTWAGQAAYSNNVRIENDLEINGNVTISSGVTKAGGTLTYLSGVVTTTGSTLFTRFATTLNTNGITWNNITTSADGLGQTITLTSNLSIGGLLTISGSTTVNRTTAETVTCAGGITQSGSILGTADIYLTGGTWTGNTANNFNNNLYLNGNITISGTVAYSLGTLTYLSGNVNTGGSALAINQVGTTTINSDGLNWNDFYIQGGGSTRTISLLSDLNIAGTFIISTSPSGLFTSATPKTVTVNNGVLFNANGGLDGTNVTLVIKGGTVGMFANGLNIDTIFDGNITFGANPLRLQGASKTYTYRSGRFITNGQSMNVMLANSIIDFHKVPLTSVVVTASITFSMNQPFVGTEQQICQVTSTGANYTIAFTDTFEKIARNVAFSGATLSRPGQLLVTTRAKFNTNRSTNVGLRYGNQVPNGVPKNNFPIWDRTLTGIQGGLQADPCFVRQG